MCTSENGPCCSPDPASGPDRGCCADGGCSCPPDGAYADEGEVREASAAAAHSWRETLTILAR